MRSGIGGRARCSGAGPALLALALGGCVGRFDRFAAQDAYGTASFGDDDQLRVRVDPGAVRTASGAFASVRAAAPLVEVRADNGTFGTTALRLRVANVRTDWPWTARYEPLEAGTRADPRCVTEDRAARPTVWAAAPDFVSTGTTTVELDLELPACTSLVLASVVDLALEVVQVGVIPRLHGDVDLLRALVADANTRGADFVHFTGDARFGADAEPFSLATAVAAVHGLPATFSLAPQDLRGDDEAILGYLGATTFVGAVGPSRLLVLDAADRSLTRGQMDFVRALHPTERESLAFMAVTPIAFGTSAGLRSALQGLQLLEALSARSFTALQSSDGIRDATRTFGPVTVRNLGARSDRVELLAMPAR